MVSYPAPRLLHSAHRQGCIDGSSRRTGDSAELRLECRFCLFLRKSICVVKCDGIMSILWFRSMGWVWHTSSESELTSSQVVAVHGEHFVLREGCTIWYGHQFSDSLLSKYRTLSFICPNFSRDAYRLDPLSAPVKLTVVISKAMIYYFFSNQHIIVLFSLVRNRCVLEWISSLFDWFASFINECGSNWIKLKVHSSILILIQISSDNSY